MCLTAPQDRLQQVAYSSIHLDPDLNTLLDRAVRGQLTQRGAREESNQVAWHDTGPVFSCELCQGDKVLHQPRTWELNQYQVLGMLVAII